MHYINVRVVDADGHPLPNVQVSIQISQFVAPGARPSHFTDARGETEFSLDVSAVADITVFLDQAEHAPPRTPRWQRTRRMHDGSRARGAER